MGSRLRGSKRRSDRAEGILIETMGVGIEGDRLSSRPYQMGEGSKTARPHQILRRGASSE